MSFRKNLFGNNTDNSENRKQSHFDKYRKEFEDYIC